MGKRKSSATDEVTRISPPSSKKERGVAVKKPKIVLEEEEEEVERRSSEEEEEEEEEEPKPKARKARNESKAAVKRDSEITVHKSSEGEKYIDLGKKKRATVRSFKGSTFVDIREFYGADGEEKPGKKGISLSLEQWEVLRNGASVIDQLFSEQEKRK